MKPNLQLFMLMLGCRPKGRHTEQHDIFFGIAAKVEDLVPQINEFWTEAKGRIHVDAWRAIHRVDDYKIEVVDSEVNNPNNLFFINLGGYKPNEFEEYHYKVLTVANTMAEASKKSKQSAFYKHCGFKGATAHIDDKYGVDVDDIHFVRDILNPQIKSQYSIQISPCEKDMPEDEWHIGYLKIM